MKSTRLVVLGVSLCLLEIMMAATEATSDPLRYRSGIRNAPSQYALKPKQLQALLNSLRAKTGWTQLAIDEDGFLVCERREQFVAGSAAARALLGAALSGALAFDLESRPNTLAVTFARLAPSVWFQSMASGKVIDAYPLQIDFADFHWLRGNDETLAAFDLGFVVLHELGHGIWRLRDAIAADDEPGECENYINRIRRELNLPERLNYFARVTQSGMSVASQNRPAAELTFAQRVSQGHQVKSEPLYLRWDAGYVGLIQPNRVVPRSAVPLLTETPPR